jgi:hypothetical protein
MQISSMTLTHKAHIHQSIDRQRKRDVNSENAKIKMSARRVKEKKYLNPTPITSTRQILSQTRIIRIIVGTINALKHPRLDTESAPGAKPRVSSLRCYGRLVSSYGVGSRAMRWVLDARKSSCREQAATLSQKKKKAINHDHGK